VLDFGLVKEVAKEDVGTTQQNTLLGTPLYLAPEAITDPNAVGARTDLYALGAVAYQLLTGHPPFEGQTVVEVCSKHLLAEPVPPSLAGAELPSGLEDLVLACLAKTPEGRPASAAALRDQLEALQTEWTAAEANDWWQSRAPKVIAAAKLGRRQSRSSSPATIAIDLARRSLVPDGAPA